jgi:serine/threonine-protein kinase
MRANNRVARRAPTPAPAGRTTGRTTGRLPETFVAEQVERLALFAAVACGLWTFGLFMDLVFLRVAASSFVPSPVVTAIELAGIAAGAAMFAYVRYSGRDAEAKANAGIGFMLLNAFGVAVLNAWTFLPQEVPAMHVSWNAVTILVFSMIASASPRRLLVASLAAASMDPLAIWLRHLTGAVTPSPLEAIVLYLPTYACAVVATLPAHVFHRLGKRLREAQELGSYELIERLGEGGMGEVWRARHRLLARSAAIKLVRPEVLGASNENEARMILRRFEREAQATAALSSPHTIRVFDFGLTDEGSFYYVMELLAGRDLESLVREFGPLPAGRAVYLLRQVCHSLADAHARGLVHRDIKPANIYACRMGLEYDFIKVLDFGLVKVSDRSTIQQTRMTAAMGTTGTPAYMAPEIILGEADVDRRADVYAVGCVAYFLLTGQLVFEADTPMKMLMQHVQARPVPPSHRTELKIPRELDDLVLACLEKDPEKRPQDAEVLFRMACGCRNSETWDQAAAQAWWGTHLPEFSGRLTLGDAIDRPAVREVVTL